MVCGECGDHVEVKTIWWLVQDQGQGWTICRLSMCDALQGMPDEYVEQHNLARMLETALACIAAEKPDDPTARLAELLK